MRLSTNAVPLPRIDPDTNSEFVLSVILDPSQEEAYRVIPKPYPGELPEFWENRKITWLTCFGIYNVETGQFENGVLQNSYIIELDESWLTGKGQLLAYIGDNLEPLSPELVNGKYQVYLDQGDPPIGVAF